MYRIIGADKNEYGPVEISQLRQWVAEGRVNLQTMVQAAGSTDWRPIAEMPELAAALGLSSGPAPAPVPPPPGLRVETGPFPSSPPETPAFNRDDDYHLDPIQCVSDAWAVYSKNFGLALGGMAVFLLIQFAFIFGGYIPLLGVLVMLANLLLAGPLYGGLYFFLLRLIRNQDAQVGDVFKGFARRMGSLILGYLVTALLIFIAILPGLLIMAYPVYQMVEAEAFSVGLFILALAGFLISLFPSVYLSVSWLFTLSLIIDRDLDLGAAMSIGRRQVGRHFFSVLILVVLTAIINLAGGLLCCFGVFFTAPLAFLTMMIGYERIFSKRG